MFETLESQQRVAQAFQDCSDLLPLMPGVSEFAGRIVALDAELVRPLDDACPASSLKGPEGQLHALYGLSHQDVQEQVPETCQRAEDFLRNILVQIPGLYASGPIGDVLFQEPFLSGIPAAGVPLIVNTFDQVSTRPGQLCFCRWVSCVSAAGPAVSLPLARLECSSKDQACVQPATLAPQSKCQPTGQQTALQCADTAGCTAQRGRALTQGGSRRITASAVWQAEDASIIAALHACRDQVLRLGVYRAKPPLQLIDVARLVLPHINADHVRLPAVCLQLLGLVASSQMLPVAASCNCTGKAECGVCRHAGLEAGLPCRTASASLCSWASAWTRSSSIASCRTLCPRSHGVQPWSLLVSPPLCLCVLCGGRDAISAHVS